jgi:4-hydroxy-4-methyl-2-oxoglutarate aldolase
VTAPTPQARQHDFRANVRDVLLRLGSATLHEAAGQIGALPSEIVTRTPSLPLAGWAFPVTCPPADNFWLHRAVYAASPGDVIVATVGGAYEAGYWGEVLSCAALSRGLAGLVIDGGVRDQARLEGVGLPVFSRTVCMRGTAKARTGRGALKSPMTVGEVLIHHGDLVVGDRDGVLVLPATRVASIIDAAEQRGRKEEEYMAKIAAGQTTLELYGLDG